MEHCSVSVESPGFPQLTTELVPSQFPQGLSVYARDPLDCSMMENVSIWPSHLPRLKRSIPFHFATSVGSGSTLAPSHSSGYQSNASYSSTADEKMFPLALRASNAPPHGVLKLTQAALPVWGPTCYGIARQRPPDHAVALRQGIGQEGTFVAFGRLLLGSGQLMIESLICDRQLNPIATHLGPLNCPHVTLAKNSYDRLEVERGIWRLDTKKEVDVTAVVKQLDHELFYEGVPFRLHPVEFTEFWELRLHHVY